MCPHTTTHVSCVLRLVRRASSGPEMVSMWEPNRYTAYLGWGLTARWERSRCSVSWYKSTCFTGTKIQILTPEELLQLFFSIGLNRPGEKVLVSTGTSPDLPISGDIGATSSSSLNAHVCRIDAVDFGDDDSWLHRVHVDQLASCEGVGRASKLRLQLRLASAATPATHRASPPSAGSRTRTPCTVDVCRLGTREREMEAAAQGSVEAGDLCERSAVGGQAVYKKSLDFLRNSSFRTRFCVEAAQQVAVLVQEYLLTRTNVQILTELCSSSLLRAPLQRPSRLCCSMKVLWVMSARAASVHIPAHQFLPANRFLTRRHRKARRATCVWC